MYTTHITVDKFSFPAHDSKKHIYALAGFICIQIYLSNIHIGLNGSHWEACVRHQMLGNEENFQDKQKIPVDTRTYNIPT